MGCVEGVTRTGCGGFCGGVVARAKYNKLGNYVDVTTFYSKITYPLVDDEL